MSSMSFSAWLVSGAVLCFHARGTFWLKNSIKTGVGVWKYQELQSLRSIYRVGIRVCMRSTLFKMIILNNYLSYIDSETAEI